MDEFKGAWDYPKAWDFGKDDNAGEYTTSDRIEPPQEMTSVQKELARLCAIEMEWNDWRKGKIGVSEHLALREENKRLRAEIAELREREKEKDTWTKRPLPATEKVE